MKSIALLSNKEGNCKISIAVNVSSYLDKNGNQFCLLDLDFQSQLFFKKVISLIPQIFGEN